MRSLFTTSPCRFVLSLVLLLICAAVAECAPVNVGYVGEPKGDLTLGMGFALVVLLTYRSRQRPVSQCEIIDIRDRFVGSKVRKPADTQAA